MKNKMCVLILPYFGKFNNYFQLFLNSCRRNPHIDWLIFTDDTTDFEYPPNVFVEYTTFQEIQNLAKNKIGIEVSLKEPYKLCDFKPTYGLVFEDYILDYKYWGHCDCDVLFGDMESLLFPLLEMNYDKIFAAGHLTMYKNTFENCRLFMSNYHDRSVYKEALMCPDIYVFDEDCENWRNHSTINIHSIFLENKRNVYTKDLSFNVSTHHARFRKAYYCDKARKFIDEDYTPRRYYWYDGHIYSLEVGKNRNVIRKEYLYIHLQMRKMRMNNDVINSNCVEVLPSCFVSAMHIPQNEFDVKKSRIQTLNMYWIDVWLKKIKNKCAHVCRKH